ncbi:MAG: type VII toxin-antitoxin system HepT family RNase toxin [Anaerolineae bacterium]
MALLDEYTADLRQLQDVDFHTYVENKLVRRTVERTLHLAVEACLDIGQHIIAQEGFRRPTDNQDVFVVLAEEGIVSDELLPSLIAMARFQNLIVHDYARIDNAIVFGILKRRLDDLDAYARAIVKYLGLLA